MVDQPKGSPMDHIQNALAKTGEQVEIESLRMRLDSALQQIQSLTGNVAAAQLEHDGMEQRISAQEDTIASLRADVANKQITIDFQLREYNMAEERAMKRLAIIQGFENFTWLKLPVGRWIVEALDRAN